MRIASKPKKKGRPLIADKKLKRKLATTTTKARRKGKKVSRGQEIAQQMVGMKRGAKVGRPKGSKSAPKKPKKMKKTVISDTDSDNPDYMSESAVVGVCLFVYLF